MGDIPTISENGPTLMVPGQGPGGATRRLSTLSSRTNDSGGNMRRPSMMMRKNSFKNVAMSLVSLNVRKNSRSMSIFGGKQQAVKPKLENSYRMKPTETEIFNCAKVRDMVKDVLKSFLEGVVYNPTECKELTQQVCALIKNRVKDLNFPRYKVVVNVIIGQNLQQDVQTASRAVWSPDTDNWVCIKHNTPNLFAIATVHGAYFE